MSVDKFRIPPDSLNTLCDPEILGFETTEEIEPLADTIGQERAISAIDLALRIEAQGFNLFVSGMPGSGRNTALGKHLDIASQSRSTPPDWGYLYNFEDPSQPKAIVLSCGMMRQLAKDMDDLVDMFQRDIPQAFESTEYIHAVEEVLNEIQTKRQGVMAEIEKEAQSDGLTVVSDQSGIRPIPVVDGRPMNQEEFGALSEEQQGAMRERMDKIGHSITHSMTVMRRLNKEAVDQTRRVDRELVQDRISPLINELKERYPGYPDVSDYLDAVEKDMLENLGVFKPKEGGDQPQGPVPVPISTDDVVLARYKVNDLVDNTNCVGAPVIIENSPTYYNLFGRIDYRARMGTFNTDLTMIKAGSVHRANGGYLVLQARDLLSSPMSWDTLKRTLRSGEVRIENIGEQYSALPTETMRPEPIPVDTKVVVIGTPDVLRVLQRGDQDFRRYFKVVADFDTVMERDTENMMKYAAFVSARCAEKNMRPFDRTAVARVIDHSSRLVEHQKKLTTRLIDVSDLLTEADYWAGYEGSSIVEGDHVAKAIGQRRYRSSLAEDRIQELIEDGTIHIDTESEEIGQVNGLAVYSLGDFAFGKPSRITARVSLGQGRMVNVERESRLSGRIHDKGFTILTGYVHGKYGQDKPLSLSASIGFEQTYSEVDGDSASSTELYALLSELSSLPIQQGIAVTGSVNQYGDVQAIGGATYKIEGFFDICKARGLTGHQGVMVPKDNQKNLVLKDEVVQAAREGKFHIYGVGTIDEGIEILTGVPAGERQEDGTYPEGTVHHLVNERLRDLARKGKAFSKSLDQEDSDEEDEATEGEADGDDTPEPDDTPDSDSRQVRSRRH